MNEKKEIDVIAKRLFQFRNEVGLSANSLSKIVGVSQSTLSRIEKGTTRVLYDNVKILANAFGVSIVEFQNENSAIPPKKKLVASLKRYAKESNRDLDVNMLLEGSNTGYYLDTYIENGFLKAFKSVGEIKEEVLREFGVALSGPQLSKLLSKRWEWGIVEKVAGEKRNTFKYKRVN